MRPIQPVARGGPAGAAPHAAPAAPRVAGLPRPTDSGPPRARKRGGAPASSAGPAPDTIARLEAAARHRAAGGRLISPDARRSLCESCGSPEVDWGSLCRRCRDRLAGRRPPSQAPEAAPEPPVAPAARRKPTRTRRRQRPVDDELVPRQPVRSIISAQPGRTAPGRPPPRCARPPPRR